MPTAVRGIFCGRPKGSEIGFKVDQAMRILEDENPRLKGALPKDECRPALNSIMPGERIDLISKIEIGGGLKEARDVLGRVYDPCCGSGGMFVQSEKFVESHGGRHRPLRAATTTPSRPCRSSRN